MPGAVCTIILLCTIFVFAGYKFNVLVEKTEYDVVVETYQYNFDWTHQFGLDDGFAIAAAIIAYDNSEEPVEDPRIGTIEFYLKYWKGMDEFSFTKLSSRLCNSLIDVGSDSGTEHGFCPLHDKMKGFIGFWEKMKCKTCDDLPQPQPCLPSS